MVQREISDRNYLGETLSPYDNARRSTAIDRTTSNYNDKKEKVKKIELMNTGNTMLTWPNIYLDCLN